MKILVDMNLSPEWLEVLRQQGWEAAHWSTIGSPKAPDAEVLTWAAEHRHVLLTQDLDFAQLLVGIRGRGPSVVLLRMGDELDVEQRNRVCRAIQAVSDSLETGALLVVKQGRYRLRRLPLFPDDENR